MAAAIGATWIFVAAAAVGANQTRQQGASALSTLQATGAANATTPNARPKPSVVRTPRSTQVAALATPPPNGPPPAQANPTPGQGNPTPGQGNPTPGQGNPT